MKKIFLLVSMIIAAFGVKAQTEFVVDANAELRQLQGSFTGIRVSGGIDLYLSQSTEEAIAVSASEEKYKENIKTVIEDGTLRIYYEGDKLFNIRNRNLKVYVSFKTLERLDASGATDVRVKDQITGLSLAITISGASDFRGSVNLEKLNISVSGASDLTIEGVATNVSISTSGASDVNAFGLSTTVCTAKASGASDISISVSGEMNAHASGASDIKFKGAALIKDFSSSGSSKISRKG